MRVETTQSKTVALSQIRKDGSCRGCQKLKTTGNLRLSPLSAQGITSQGGCERTQIAACLSLERQLSERTETVSLPDFVAIPSKGGPQLAVGMIFYRDLVTENQVETRVAERLGRREVFHRVKKIDPSCSSLSPMATAAGRVISGSAFKDNRNFFLFAPDGFGLQSNDATHHVAVEFLDKSEMLLTNVGSCVEELFGAAVFVEYKTLYNPSTMPFSIMAASLAHETGHHCSPVRVIPNRDPRVAGLSSFIFDTIGELLADAAGSEIYTDVFGLRLPVYSLLYRPLQYSRTAFVMDSINGPMLDNDALGGAYCWALMEAMGVLTWRCGQFRLDLNRAGEVWERILASLQTILHQVISAPLADQDRLVRDWLGEMVPRDDQGRFAWPRSMEVALRRCEAIPS